MIIYVNTGWWFGTCFFPHHIGNVMIPTDEIILGRYTNHQPVHLPGSQSLSPVTCPCPLYKVGPLFVNAKLVNITPITMVYGRYNELVNGVNLNQLITGGYIC